MEVFVNIKLYYWNIKSGSVWTSGAVLSPAHTHTLKHDNTNINNNNYEIHLNIISGISHNQEKFSFIH